MKQKFRIFYNLYGGPNESIEIDAHTPEKATIKLRQQYAGTIVVVRKIKRVKQGEKSNV